MKAAAFLFVAAFVVVLSWRTMRGGHAARVSLVAAVADILFTLLAAAVIAGAAVSLAP